MSTGDIMPFENSGGFSMGGSKTAYVAASVNVIYAGEPVEKLTGAAGVIPAATNFPTTTLRCAGVATSDSTNTASVSGTVDVIPPMPGQIWLIKPKVPATWDTQAEYNALVGAQVLIDLTSGVYTLLASHATGNGCCVEYLDISKYPGYVAFSWNMNTAYNAF